ncbi:hypothetical protein M9Y10_038510 [Tritrichomonas musculus]|uniref:DDE-1 domain-containing protein n=1 Tax=Tritrichomonas musculus TaxID=1915356 RepID=A0ABR2KBS6_9EUKA
MDAERVEVFLIVIEKHYEDLNKVLEAYIIPPGFCFNVDEKGFIDSINIKIKTIMVPIDSRNNITFGSDRNAKRVTLIGAFLMDGSKLKPMRISPNKRIEKN